MAPPKIIPTKTFVIFSLRTCQAYKGNLTWRCSNDLDMRRNYLIWFDWIHRRSWPYSIIHDIHATRQFGEDPLDDGDKKLQIHQLCRNWTRERVKGTEREGIINFAGREILNPFCKKMLTLAGERKETSYSYTWHYRQNCFPSLLHEKVWTEVLVVITEHITNSRPIFCLKTTNSLCSYYAINYHNGNSTRDPV